VAQNSTTIARLTDARYPDWGRVIPQEPPIQLFFFSAPEMLSALKRLRLVSGEVIITGAEGESTITLSASGDGEGEELIEINSAPLVSDLKIKLSIPFISQALAIPDHWQVKAHYFGSDRPLLLLGEGLYALIMPMVLS
jgi:DNA polymerase III sliding clamp (beta) subunit (PCNA family)